MYRKTFSFLPQLAVGLIVLLFAQCGSDSRTLTWQQSAPKAPAVKALKVYVENSGSMDGYVASGTTFKDAVYDYVSALSTESQHTHLAYINSEVIPFGGGVEAFVRDLTPASFAAAGGNRASSDIASLLTRVLQANQPGEVSMFISDCILALPASNSADYYQNRRIQLRNAFAAALKKRPDLGVVVLRMSSTFTGAYYAPEGKAQLSGVERPYYIWLIGDAQQLGALRKGKPFEALGTANFKNWVGFATQVDVPFRITNEGLIGQPQSCVATPGAGSRCHFVVHVDLSATLVGEEWLQDTKHYHATPSPQLVVEKVEAKAVEGSTHRLYLGLHTKTPAAKATLTLDSPTLPQWVDTYNAPDAGQIRSRMSQTAGIKYLIGGVADAYAQHSKRMELRFHVE